MMQQVYVFMCFSKCTGYDEIIIGLAAEHVRIQLYVKQLCYLWRTLFLKLQKNQ